MRRRDVLLALPATAALGPIARSEELRQPYRVGLMVATGEGMALIERRIIQLGHVEGRDIVFERRVYEGILERLQPIAADLVRVKADVIVAQGPEAVLQAAQSATRDIPIVMVALDFDPLARGYVAGLARPGGNITGVSVRQIELAQKRLQLLAEAVPTARRIAVLIDAFSTDQFAGIGGTAAQLNLALIPIDLGRPPYDFAIGLAILRERPVDAVLVLMSPVFFRRRAELVDGMSRQNVPASYGLREFAEAGGLMSYGPNFAAMEDLAADYVDKILKGSKPTDLPVQQPTKFELVMNLKTAKALSLAIPSSFLARADEVIE